MSAFDPKRTLGLKIGSRLCAISRSRPGRNLLSLSLHKPWSLRGHMRRRDFLIILGCTAVAWPLAAHAQQGERMRRIGVLMAFAESDHEAQSWVAAFREELRKLGWTEGRNIEIDTRWATADVESMQRLGKEFVALQPDLILTSSTPATATMLQQTRTIPIIFVWVADPVGSGFVASLPRPGGNVTGFTPIEASLGGKWVEMLKEIAPRVGRVAMIFNPTMATFVDECRRTYPSEAGAMSAIGRFCCKSRLRFW
jgi:putative ABC transport system substrate-binding protein